jgi:hypothetical protein
MTMASTSKSVAAKDDVSATPGTAPFTGADQGTWTAGEINAPGHPEFQVGGAAAISEASCVFSFQGTNSGTGAVVPGQETVTLTSGTTKLHIGQVTVLVDGDEASGNGGFGNKLTVASTRKLATS